jgi:hypothetical protein
MRMGRSMFLQNISSTHAASPGAILGGGGVPQADLKLPEPLPPERWLPLAAKFDGLLKQHGLRHDRTRNRPAWRSRCNCGSAFDFAFRRAPLTAINSSWASKTAVNKSQRAAGRFATGHEPTFAFDGLAFNLRAGVQERSVPSSSFSAHLITASSFSPPCVNLATITVLMAWL